MGVSTAMNKGHSVRMVLFVSIIPRIDRPPGAPLPGRLDENMGCKVAATPFRMHTEELRYRVSIFY
jgi:hypothetical protein